MGRKKLYIQRGAITNTKEKILNDIYTSHIIEEITENVAGRMKDNEKDLVQDIYLYLLELPDDKLKGMEERKEMRWFITRMITNQYNSNTSAFFKKYRKLQLLSKTDYHEDTDYYDYYGGDDNED